MIYLDNAATTGVKPPSVIKAVGKALSEYSANPGRSGHGPSVKTAMAVYAAREKVADFFGASGAENVIFTMNCTHSLNCVIKGVLRKGDHVIVSSLEHNAVMRPLAKTGVDYDVARVSLTNDRLTLQEFENKIRINTKMIICTAASNVIGKVLPIIEIGRLCRARGLLFAVDAAQTAGVLPINIKYMNIDYLCVAPHKGLYAPMGIGVLICEKPIADTLIEGGTGTNSVDLFQPEAMPERLESGTVNVPAILGTAAGIDFVNNKGTVKIYNHELELCRHLYRVLSDIPDIVLYTPEPEKIFFVPLVSFNFKGIPSVSAAQILNERGIAVRGGLHCAPTAHRQIGTLDTGTVRVCPGAFNSLSEIKVLEQVIRSIKFV